jgi:serine/threonine protein kinase
VTAAVRVGQRLGKYRIDRRLAEGGFAAVYRAYDTIAGVPVALKLPHPRLMTKETLEAFRKEVRLTARLDHPNILPVKDAGFIDGIFVIASPLGDETLDDRLRRRLSTRTIIRFAEQMLEAVAFAHEKRILHGDIKPETCVWRTSALPRWPGARCKRPGPERSDTSPPNRRWESRRCARTFSR